MLVEPECFKRQCKHFLGVIGSNEFNEGPNCEAFPKGIPREIAYGENKHIRPFKGDHGIQYEREAVE